MYDRGISGFPKRPEVRAVWVVSAPATMPWIETPLSSQRSDEKSSFLIERERPFTYSS